MATVSIKNMMFYGFHGVYEYEREQGQKFFLDVTCETKDDKVHAMAFRREGGDFLVAWDRTEGYVLTKAPPKGERFRSPEPWVSHWTAEKPFEIPVVGPAQLVNAIGQVRTVKPGKASSVTVALTGAPVIVRNVDLAKITIR